MRTESRWLQASVETDYPRLIDLLNGDCQLVRADQVVLQGDMYVYRGDTGSSGCLCPGRALLVVPLDAEESTGVAEPGHRGGVGTDLARLGVGPFEVTGYVHLPEGTSLDECLVQAEERFIVVNRAVVRRADGAGPVEHQGLVFVNRERIDYLLPAPALPLFDLTQGQLD
jgi:hypothetical protein